MRRVAFLFAVLTVLSAGAFAEVPQVINYQGRLTDSDGFIVADDDYEMVFSIYESPSDVDFLWSSGPQVVTVLEGLFNYQLGSAVPLPDDLFFNDSLRYLGIRIGDDPEIIPRSKLTSVAYSYHALRSDTAGYARTDASGWVDDGVVVRLKDGGDFVGIGTETPMTQLNIVGISVPPDPLVQIEQTGEGRGLWVKTPIGFCALISESGNHGLRVIEAGSVDNPGADGIHVMHAWHDGIHVVNADNNGIHVENAIGWAGYFNGPGYFSGNLGIGLESLEEKLEVAGNIRLVPEGITANRPMTVYVKKSQGVDEPGHDLEIFAGEYSSNSGIETLPGGNLLLHGGRGMGPDKGGHVYIYGGDEESSLAPTGDVILAHTGSVSGGNVGIGTATPARVLHVNDIMRLEPRTSPPLNPSEGDIYMDATDHKLKVYDGLMWRSCW